MWPAALSRVWLEATAASGVGLLPGRYRLVVNDHVLLAAMAFPARSSIPVVTVAVYVAPRCSELVGSSFARLETGS